MHMPHLEALRLMSCNMSALGARELAASLGMCTAITTLDLNRTFWAEQVPPTSRIPVLSILAEFLLMYIPCMYFLQ